MRGPTCSSSPSAVCAGPRSPKPRGPRKNRCSEVGPMRPMYNDGARELQDHFDSRRIADRLEQVTVHQEFTDSDRAFIASRAMFFLGTADTEGWPDVSYKGGLPGFVRVLDARTLAWADYDGNGMF